MFVDRAKIMIKSGKGGDGIVSFRREKYVPRGGPDGGDGGRGGSVFLCADKALNTLTSFRYSPRYIGPDGKDGTKQRCSGAAGEDLIIRCPVGTIAHRLPDSTLVADLDEHGKRLLIAQGGRGGKGNQHYATPSRQAPRICTPGTLGESFELQLELKLIADIGLAGMPNAGKSSLLARLSNAHPEIANYPFTTLKPHLGVVEIDRERAFVMADLPGLIEGASDGVGLGHDFLRHLERTRVIAIVLDAAGTEGRDPLDDYRIIAAELADYSPQMSERVGLIIANKNDLPLSFDADALQEETGLPVLTISAATGEGIDKLLKLFVKLLADKGLWNETSTDDRKKAAETFNPLA